MTTKTANWPSTPALPDSLQPETTATGSGFTDEPITVTGLVLNAHVRACRKGWWGDKAEVDGFANAIPGSDSHPGTFNLGEKVAKIHSEVSEAFESWGLGEPVIWYAENGKPEGLAIELADVIIRVADLCGAANLPIEKAIRIKSAYNETRTRRHGDKKA
jgi:NTP pyrophosphatase (non-canonical NTP hydrolase)